MVVAAIAIFFLQLTYSLINAAQNTSPLLAKSRSKPTVGALKEIYRFSAHKNVLHLILDGSQSNVFEETIDNKLVTKPFSPHSFRGLIDSLKSSIQRLTWHPP